MLAGDTGLSQSAMVLEQMQSRVHIILCCCLSSLDNRSVCCSPSFAMREGAKQPYHINMVSRT